jgi:DNA ligase-1
MQRFARLYAELDATTSTSKKVDALERYFRDAPARDAAWAVYFLAGNKPRQIVPVRLLARIATEAAGIPDWLFDESYQAVGDLAETIAHLVPERSPSESGELRGGVAPLLDTQAVGDLAETIAHLVPERSPGPSSTDLPLADWIETRLLALRGADEAEVRARMSAYWGELDANGRLVFNKLITGAFRVGVSRLLVQRAIAAVANVEPRIVAERLAGEWTPTPERYLALVAPEAPEARRGQPYPFFLAHPLQGVPEALGPVDDWVAEWKWDGIRAQVLRRDGAVFIWSRGEELVTERFPEIARAAARLPDGTALDGELMAWRDGAPLPFATLQTRIGRRKLTPKALEDAPVAFLAFDLIEVEATDIRDRPLEVRRSALAPVVAYANNPALRVSPIVGAADWATLATMRRESRMRGVEGLMLKRRDSPYGVGRTRGDWWKWKVDPYSVDAVLVYAQRGHGRRASLYTDYTFAVRDGDALVPFAKAYSGLTDAEMREVDAFIRRNTVEKFGPVRAVRPELVFEIGFEGIQRSPRHKSGIAVRFPRMLRMRRDKRIEEADTLERLHALIDGGAKDATG